MPTFITSKWTLLNIALITLFLMLFPFSASYAKAGCCSGHGGVASCDKDTGHQVCKDGSKASATCTCKMEKTSQRGCCSGHGGVAKCDAATHKSVCKDNTASSCECTK